MDRDLRTGNKLINQYEILEELGRGEHGKVKLGRLVETRQQVAIKIVQRYSKRRRLGRLGNAEDKVKKEVAILKKARHPNVVSLLEVIDDPNRQKVYIVLEYVENGEIVWRRKGLPEIVHVDKLRLDREKHGISDSPSFLEESQQYIKTAQRLRRQQDKARERRKAHAAYARQHAIPAWSLEHGAESDEDGEGSDQVARTTSRSNMNNDSQFPSGYTPVANQDALSAIEGSMYGAYVDYYSPDRRMSSASSLGYAVSEPDLLSDDDDMSYVPCLTIGEARNAFRDSVLGVEYLHYQGIIHRDIKPANLLVTSSHHVKISDFGVSYLGRPIRDEEEEQVTEMDATELDDARELSKTVGTPAFYAPELCYTGDDFEASIGTTPKITGAIDVWSLGVTLYGMIFGRLPFVSDDEYSMFQTIVKTEVFIPRKRLRPVEDDPSTVSQWPRSAFSNKRSEDELVYEEINDELYDLLRRLLTKDPYKRITLKEIKHHPWILHGLPNPRAWVDDTDPSYQSKGKRIEVSNEEVTSAVIKVPFIQRVRSNVAKWSTYFTGRSKDKDSRKRTPSASPSVDSSSGSSSNTLGKYLWEARRGSLRGDEDGRTTKQSRDSEHPLSQSVTASPVEHDGQTSYFGQESRLDLNHPRLWHDRTPRPDQSERASTLSTAESQKTVRPANDAPRSSTPTIVEALGTSGFGGLRRLARGFQTGDWRSERSSSADATDGGRGEPSLALNVASAVGQVQTPDLREENSSSQVESPGSGHRHHRPHFGRKSSAEPLHLTKEALRHRKYGDHADSGQETNGHFRQMPESSGTHDCPNNGLTTSPPSAATISSSSVDDSASGMSQSASHPSIPSVVSGASSISGDGHVKEKEDKAEIPQVPPILRTGETVKARRSTSRHRPEDDESRYDCDDEEESSDDEVLIIGKKKPPRTHTSNQ